MIKDTHELQNFNAIQAPKLKGHVKVMFHNPTTGKTETVSEGENIVTNAVGDIFANNIFGAVDNSKMTPIWQTWYGGILVYANPHPSLSPTNYYPQDSTTNPVTAHAGDEVVVSAADDPSRGSPVTSEFTIDATSVKQRWEWTPAQGVGAISALSLTHKDTGNAGLGSTSNAFQAFSPFMEIQAPQLGSISTGFGITANVFTQYDANHGLAFYIGTDGEYSTSNYRFSTSNISIQIKVLGYDKVGLFEGITAIDTNIIKATVQTHVTFYQQPSFYFDYTNKKLWLFSNYTGSASFSNDWIKYTVIDLSDLTDIQEEDWGTETTGSSHLAIHSDASDLAPTSFATGEGGNSNVFFYNIVKNGDYFYFYTTTKPASEWNMYNSGANPYSGFKKIPIGSGAQSSVTFSNPIYTPRSGMANGGLIIYGNSVVNGANAYPITIPSGSVFQTKSSLINSPNKISSFTMPFSYDETRPRPILASKMLNTTLYNLESTQTKTAGQSMVIEYTLTYASGE